MKKFFCSYIFLLFFLLNCYSETPSMQLILIQGKKETIFYEGAPISSVQKKIENAKLADDYIKSAIENIIFKIIINDQNNQESEYKVYNQYTIIKDAKDVYDCDIFFDLCILFINSTNDLAEPQSIYYGQNNGCNYFFKKRILKI